MSKPIEVTDSSFSKDVLASDVPVIVDFWAAWCGPCKMIAPVLEELAEELGNSAKVAKIDVDKNPEKASEYNVRSIPTLLLFKGGKMVDTKIGFATKEALIRWIEQA